MEELEHNLLARCLREIEELKTKMRLMDSRITAVRDSFNGRNREICAKIETVKKQNEGLFDEARKVARLEVADLREWKDIIDVVIAEGIDKEQLRELITQSGQGLAKQVMNLTTYCEENTAPFINAAINGTLNIPQLQTAAETTAETMGAKESL